MLVGINKYAEGSCLIVQGDTKVHVTASIDDRVPRWALQYDHGWVTGEYGMLPRSTSDRSPREAARGRQGGRTREIQRLIGRSLRAACDLQAIGQRTITIDCDVLQADGGTRTASVTAGYLALAQACRYLQTKNLISQGALIAQVAAVSVGIVGGEPMLDLCYSEDSQASVDMNVVMTADGGLVEVQATAEGEPYSPEELDEMLDLARAGIDQLIEQQNRVLEESAP